MSILRWRKAVGSVIPLLMWIVIVFNGTDVTAGACLNRIYMGKVSIIYKPFEVQRSRRIKKIPEFLYRVAVEKGILMVMRGMGYRCIGFKSVKYKEAVLTPCSVNSAAITEFYKNYEVQEKEFLKDVLRHQGVTWLIFWEPVEVGDINEAYSNGEPLQLCLRLYDAINEMSASKYIKLDLKKWRRDPEDVMDRVTKKIEEAVNEIKFNITQSEEE